MNRRLPTPTSEEVGRSLLDDLASHKRRSRAESHQTYCEQSGERLKKNIETKIKTTMIGALSQVETSFGFLWGHGKRKDQPLSGTEQQMLELYDKLRTEILNLGNNQIRAAKAEIDQYKVDWQRYQYETSAENPKPLAIFGLDDNGKPKKPRYGLNSDGSLEGQENE